MAGTPDAALGLLKSLWTAVEAPTRRELTESRDFARSLGESDDLKPWDRLYYTERLGASRYGIDAESVRPYLSLDGIYDAIFWCAGELFGFEFEAVDAPVFHSSIRVYEVKRNESTLGLIWFDLFSRPGKSPGSWQYEIRQPEHAARNLPGFSLIAMNLPPPANGEPPLLNWQYAKILFHEFGHALHMIASRAPYPSLGSMAVPWDFVEVPSLLNERWLERPEVLARFARHRETGAPMPAEMIDAIGRSMRAERSFTLSLDAIAASIIDLLLHRSAKADIDIDAARFESEILADLDMPAEIGLTVRTPASSHIFGGGAYAAGLYSYIWADVMAADIADAFATAPGGFFNRAVAAGYFEELLSAGATVPLDDAFAQFRKRPPRIDALLDRFGLRMRA